MVDNNPSHESILDRVLQSQQTDALEHFDSVNIVGELLKQLSTKEADVLRRRFGLGHREPETLETIGQTYQVTRERVRQIERWAIQRLRTSATTKSLLRSLDVLLQQLFEERGGIMIEDELLRQLHSHTAETPGMRAATVFLLQELMADKVVRVNAKNLKPYWQLAFVTTDLLSQTIAEAEHIIAQVGQPLTRDDLLAKFKAIAFWQNHREQLTEGVILSYLSVAQGIEKNPYGEYGLRSWGSIVPKRMNDKILLVMRKHGRPMHFHEITEKINAIGFDHRQAYPPTVHNELILNKEYVLVGRGIYALREWGYKPGVVADVIRDVLERAGKPLSRDEIVELVLQQRMVKRNTIHLALTNKAMFHRETDGRYGLVNRDTNTNPPHDHHPA